MAPRSMIAAQAIIRNAGAASRPPRLALRWSSSTATVKAEQNSSRAPKPIDDSTSALLYKQQRRKPPPLPTYQNPRSPTAEEAVTNILYNTPPPSSEPYKRHTLNCLVQNEPGVLSRVSGILAGRGFNIDSLVVCQTEIRDLSRMCIVLRGQDGVIEQARRQLEDLVPVWAVLDYTNTPRISRELLLCKVSILGPEYVEQQMAGGPTHSPHGSGPAIPNLVTADGHSDPTSANSLSSPPSNTSTSDSTKQRAAAETFESSGAPTSFTGTNNSLSQSEALIAKNLHLNSIKLLADQFGGRIVDVSENSVIVEMTAKNTRVDAFLSLMRPFGVLEAARSGVMVMPRTPVASPYDDEEVVVAGGGPVDASMLPPG